MKSKIATLILLLTITTGIMGQEKKQKGFDVTKEVTINVSAEQLWKLVGIEFEDAYKWASSVDHSQGMGQAQFEGATCDKRSCDLNASGFSSITEKVTNFNSNNMNFAYEVTDGMPKFIIKAANNWRVVSLGDNKSKLVMNAEFRVKGLMGNMMKGMMKNKMSKLLDVVLNDAKVYAETGSPSKVKKDRIAKLENKKKKAA